MPQVSLLAATRRRPHASQTPSAESDVAEGRPWPAAWRWRSLVSYFILLGALLGGGAPPTSAAVRWSKRGGPCEPPYKFYLTASGTAHDGHQTGGRPCCPLVPGMCPGGDTCTVTNGNSVGSCHSNQGIPCLRDTDGQPGDCPAGQIGRAHV